MKKFFKKLFGRRVRQTFLLAVLASIAVLGYLHWWGVPRWIKDAVLVELSKRGIEAEFGSLTFDPWRGMVGEDVSVRIPGSDKLHLQADEIRLQTDVPALLRGKVAIQDLEFSNSVFSMEVAEEGGGTVPVQVQDVNGIFAFDAERTLIIRDLHFKFLNIAFHIKGALATRQTAKSSGEHKPLVLKKSWVEALQKWQRVEAGKPLDVDIEVAGDIRDKESLSVVMKLRGQNVRYDHFTILKARGEVVFKDGAVRVEHLGVETADGSIDLQGSYDTRTRDAVLELACDGKPGLVKMILPADQKKHLDGVEAAQPMALRATVRAAAGDWAQAEAAFDLHARGLSCRGVLFQDVRVKGHWKDKTLHVPELIVTRAEGSLSGNLSWQRETGELRFLVDSTINFDELEPIFPEKSRNAFKTFTLTTAPQIHLAGTRNLKDPDSLKAAGSVEIKNFTGNDIPVLSFRSKIEVSGPVIRFVGVECRKKEGRITGDFALNTRTSDLQIKAKSDIYPVEIAAIIGPKTKRSLEPYHFPTVPKITWSGVYNLKHRDLCDLKIDVTSAKFTWWKVNLNNVKARVWVGPQSIEVTNLTSNYYTGKLDADVVVDITEKDSKVGVRVNLVNVDFKPFNEDLFGYKNVDGKLTGHAWAAGVTGKQETWVGDGWLKIEEGELWRIPIFGDLGKVLGTIIPGFGSPKARYAESKFEIADAKARMDDIKVDSLIVTLTAKGTYHFDQRLDFIVQGHLLRKLFFIGWVLDPITKIAELKLTGTLKKWEWSTAYIPGL